MRQVKSEIESPDSKKPNYIQDTTAKPTAAAQPVLKSEQSLPIRERLTQMEQERAANIKLHGQLLDKMPKQGEDFAALMKEVDKVSSRMSNGDGPRIG